MVPLTYITAFHGTPITKSISWPDCMIRPVWNSLPRNLSLYRKYPEQKTGWWVFYTAGKSATLILFTLGGNLWSTKGYREGKMSNMADLISIQDIVSKIDGILRRRKCQCNDDFRNIIFLWKNSSSDLSTGTKYIEWLYNIPKQYRPISSPISVRKEPLT